MSLERADIEKIAHLARLAVSEDQTDALVRDLSGILGLVKQMDAVDTTGVVPMAHPLHMAQRLREDVVTEPNNRERFLAIAPSVENGLFLVPRVLE